MLTLLLHYLNLLTFQWPTILIVSFITLYFYSTRNHRYWSSRGVKGPKPLPLIGNLYEVILRARPNFEVDRYRKYGKIYGYFNGSHPVLCLSEPELIRDVMVRDFHLFVDRISFSLGSPIFDRSLLTARGDDWKRIRTIVSPTFSTGKMRKMQVLIKDSVQRLDKVMEKLVQSDDQNNVNIRKLLANYTMDVIALCAFAIKLETNDTGAAAADDDNDGEHPFVRNARQFFRPSARFAIFFLINKLMPIVYRYFSLSFIDEKYIDYFKTNLTQIISERKLSEKSENFHKNVDFLQLLIDAQNKSQDIIQSSSSSCNSSTVDTIDDDIKQEVEIIAKSLKDKSSELEDIDILATSLIFLLAGYETTSSTLSHLIQELALNPDIQQKLFDEINGLKEMDDSNYEDIERLPYLDACISETLRRYSPLVFTTRFASKDYELGDTGLTIPKGMEIHIPIYAIHHDPQYYPNPLEFRPDRFLPDLQKSRLNSYTYLPFGTGPRNCVGMRFALMNMKTAAVQLVRKYRFRSTSRTKSEFQYKKFVVFTQAIDMGTIGVDLR